MSAVTGLPAGAAVHPDTFDLVHEPVPAAAAAAGTPSTAARNSAALAGWTSESGK
ncbi:hypothetical protein [Arthrobacter caoxuetaonis]|uniref:hypothetical protein n=1 Tax=Arthrobacter caoxuetaonis TaxID=2886935 RepID=UPI001D150665|nr:hypothetical protein [Arthrobacter caoxuetaonis]MCC3282183.1 hypothetical protein [Arthrobacter caoxuetaonis]